MAKFSDAKSGAYCMCTRERCSDECKTYRRFRPQPTTNADKIRAMSDEELASFITSDLCELLCGSPLSCDGDCDKKMLDWLGQEANDGKEEKEENQPAK